jgi:arylsulfatase A-like enzyme
MVERRMLKGKRTPFASDTVVPMVVIGPGIPAGIAVNDMTSTIDLAPTFTDLLGGTTPSWVDGRSLRGFLGAGKTPENWRDAALSESLGISSPEDPDYQKNAPPRYFALRTPQWLYVEYQDGSRTLYNRDTDPFEMVNIIKTADPLLVASMSNQLSQLSTCSGDTCRVADTFELPLQVSTN